MNRIAEILVVVCCVGSMASAQTTMTLGTFGYTKVNQPAGFSICGMQFDNPTNNPTTVYGDSLEVGSQIYLWNGSTYSSASYGQVFVPGTGLVTKWDADPLLGNGDGYWVQSAVPTNTVLSGAVPMDDVITNSIVSGFQLCSFPYPVDRVVTNLGFTPTSGDQIYVWNGSGYTSSSYGSVFVPGTGLVTKWDNETLQIGVGEGFWYYSTVNTDWIVSRPYPKN